MSQTQVETSYRGPNAANVNIPKYVQVAETTHEREQSPFAMKTMQG
jgi:hypothetical protein